LDISNSEVLTNDHPSLNIQQAPAGALCLVNQPIRSPQQLNIPNEEATAPTFDIQLTLINLIRSDDKMLAIAYTTPYMSHIEWKLVQVDMDYTLNHHPSALQDGKLFVNFLICHPSDLQFNAPNQPLWLEYHERRGRYSVIGIYHLVKLSRNTQAYLHQKNLVPFSKWITLTPESLIHGPFNFATLSGRKTSDRVPISVWQAINAAKSRYNNFPPRLTQPSYGYSYHVNT
jgi:hypothetical protein